MIALLYLIFIAGLVCLTYLQTSRSIYVRSSGLFLMLGAALFYGLQLPEPPIVLWVILSACTAPGFLSDFYTATLRTWYFRVSDEVFWGMIIGGMIGVFFLPMAPSLLFFLLGSWIGAMIGYIRSGRTFSIPLIFKACTSAFTGTFGMALKLLMGMEMTYWFIYFTRFSTPT